METEQFLRLAKKYETTHSKRAAKSLWAVCAEFTDAEKLLNDINERVKASLESYNITEPPTDDIIKLLKLENFYIQALQSLAARLLLNIERPTIKTKVINTIKKLTVPNFGIEFTFHKRK